MTLVTLRDMRARGICVGKTRQWFVKHNLDFRDFAKNGIDSEKLLLIDDNKTEVLAVIANAKEREAQQDGRGQ